MAGSTIVHEVSMAKAMRGITIQVKVAGQLRYRVRMWASCQLIKLAAIVAGCDVAIDLASKSDDPEPDPVVGPGSMTLSDWRDLPETTRIDGGRIDPSVTSIRV